MKFSFGFSNFSDSAKSLDQLETPRIEETVLEPMIDFDALLAETIAERRSEKSEVRNEPLLETQSQVGTSRQPSISSSVNSPSSEVGVVTVAIPGKSCANLVSRCFTSKLN